VQAAVRPECKPGTGRNLTTLNEQGRTVTRLGIPILLFCAGVLFGSTYRADATFSPPANSDDIDAVLSWLPTDTETITVANGPFWMSNFQLGEEQQRVVSKQNLEKYFQSLTLGSFNFKESLVEKHFEGQKISLAVEGSRRFRFPQGLGGLPYEGCSIAVFGDDQSDREAKFMTDASKIALRVEEIEGQKVAVFQEKMEEDLWTFFVVLPKKNVVSVARFTSGMEIRRQAFTILGAASLR
jgi:hypothetical protein